MYLIALLPALLPFLLGVFSPQITEQNFSFTVVASALASLLYGPLFDPTYRPIITGLSVAVVLAFAIGTEVAKLKYMTPSLVSIIALLLFGSVMLSYIQTYVVQRVDTPLMEVTNYILGYLQSAGAMVDKVENMRTVVRFFGGREALEQIQNIDQLIATIRDYVLAFQSRVGALFVLPAFLFWGGLTYALLCELHFSRAAQITFHNRMRKPLL